MRICWIIDNKYRDLYNLFNIKQILNKKEIILTILNKYHCLEYIDFLRPEYVVIPQFSKLGITITEYCQKKKIKVILINSEGFVEKRAYANFYPHVKKIKKLHKIFCTTKSEVDYVSEKGFKKKILITGSLRHYNIEKKNYPKKVKNIGIISTNKYIASRFNKNIIEEFLHRKKNGKEIFKDFISYEMEFLNFLTEIEKLFYKKNVKFLFRPHPLEDKNSYKDFNFEIDNSSSTYEFLKKVDIVINDYSSLALECYLSNVPVLNIRKIILYRLKHINNYLPLKFGYKVYSYKNLKELILNKNFLIKYNISRDIKNEIDKELCRPIDTVKTISDYFIINKRSTKKSFSFFKFLKILIREIKVFIKFGDKHVYKFFLKRDNNFMKHFSNKYEFK